MDFGGLVCSGNSWELILGFLSGPNASWVSVLPTKPAEKVWATSKKIFWGGCTNTMKSLNSYNEDVTLKVFITIFIAAPVPFAVVCSVWRQCSMSTLWGQDL